MRATSSYASGDAVLSVQTLLLPFLQAIITNKTELCPVYQGIALLIIPICGSLHQQAQRVFQNFFDALHELRSLRAVGDAVIGADGGFHAPAHTKCAICEYDGHLSCRTNCDNRGGGWVDDGDEVIHIER